MVTFSNEPGSFSCIEELTDFIEKAKKGGPSILYFLALPTKDAIPKKIVLNAETELIKSNKFQDPYRYKIQGYTNVPFDGSQKDPLNFEIGNGFNSLLFTNWWHAYAYQLRVKK